MNKKVLVAVAILGMSIAAEAKSVFIADKGVICDRKSNLCVDKYGISMGLTQEYLGQKAVDRLNRVTNNMKGMDTKSFTLSNGLSCDSDRKIFKKSKWDDKPNPYWTKVLYNLKVGDSGSHHGSGVDMVQMEKDCKMYVVTKTNLPMAAVSVRRGDKDGNAYYIPVSIKWDEPFVEERGECRVVNGIVKNYKATN